jgi:hypothetical protein
MSGDIWCGAEPGDYSALVAKAGPCRLGGKHSEPCFNGMVYCEHGVSVYACHQGCTDLPPLDPKCLKAAHASVHYWPDRKAGK